jgi:uncharacterized protein (UPF0248 family)
VGAPNAEIQVDVLEEGVHIELPRTCVLRVGQMLGPVALRVEKKAIPLHRVPSFIKSGAKPSVAQRLPLEKLGWKPTADA